MKKFLFLILIASSFGSKAQWANTTNLFYDSLHIPVSTAPLTQKNPIILKSEADGGYFVIWEDERFFSINGTDIYAQKYNSDGVALWANNGIPVANGTNSQRYAFSSNQDYRNRSFAAADTAGGFYICYVDDSVNNYSWERITVQHVLSDGSRRFGNVGFIVAATPPGGGFTYSAPLLIGDDNGGYYVSFSKNELGENKIYVFDYRDEFGVMKYYGGGRVNDNAIQRQELSPCGTRLYLDYPSVSVQDYNIWPDGQGGCNVVIAMNGNGAGQGRMLAYNRIWRAKKNSNVLTYVRNTSGLGCPRYEQYIKDNVYMLYQLKFNTIVTTCGGSGGPIYVVTSYWLTSNGYQLIAIGDYDYNFPKGTTVKTDAGSNINIDMIAVTTRSLTNNTTSDFIVKGYVYSSEKFDSVPYQRASYTNPELGFNNFPPLGLNKLNFFRDTMLGRSNYYVDFSLANGGGKIYLAGLMGTYGNRDVKLQYLSVENISSDSIAVQYKTDNKEGVSIGKEASTGFSSGNITYDFPLVAMSQAGDALFYTRDYYRGVRVSPIVNGTELKWGAMGRSAGTGLYNGNYYNLEQPVALIEPYFGSGVMAFRDNRTLTGNASGENIFMQHLDSMLTFDVNDYQPPYRLIRPLYPNAVSTANPAVLLGTSKRFSSIDVYSSYGAIGTSPTVDLLDDKNFGNVQVNIFQHNGVPRVYNNQLFLNRNFNIKPANNPGDLKLRLFFTKQEFDMMKAADNAIISPGDLVVIRQPNATTNVPSTYAPVTGEQVISVQVWKQVADGYYIEFTAQGSGNFFIEKPGSALVCAGGNISFTSAVAGAAYQWQVNPGSGFTNITNNTNYAGANTITLQLNTVPSSWYGYQYRCVVDGVPGAVYALKFSTTWSGSINNDWENPANWSCGSVPDANTDVVVTAGTIIVNSNVTIRSLKVTPGVSVTVKTGFGLKVLN